MEQNKGSLTQQSAVDGSEDKRPAKKKRGGSKTFRKTNKPKSGGRVSSPDLKQASSETSPEDSPQPDERSRRKKARGDKRRKHKASARDRSAKTDSSAAPVVNDRAPKSMAEESQTGERPSKRTRSPSVESERDGEIKVERDTSPTSVAQPSSADKPGEKHFPAPSNAIGPKTDSTKAAPALPDDYTHSDKGTGLKTLDSAFVLTTSTTRAPSHARVSLDSQDDGRTRERSSELHRRLANVVAQDDVGQEAMNATRAEEIASKKEGLKGGVTNLQVRSAVGGVSPSECEAARDQPTGTLQKSTRDEQSLRSSSVFGPPLEGSSTREYLSLPPPCGVDSGLETQPARRWLSPVDGALLLFITVCSLAVLWALLFGKETLRVTPLISKNLIALEGLEKFCETTSCRSAVREMAASADLSFEPCSDLQSFACGHWCAIPIPPAATYWREHSRRYIAAVHASVLSIRRRALFTGQPFYYMSAFYASCLGVLGSRKASISDSWAAAGIDAHRWMNASDFKDLFALIVDVAARSNLMTVYRIQFYGEESVDVMTGSAIDGPAIGGGWLRRMLVEEAAAELGLDAESLQAKIWDIDIAVRDAIENASTSASDRQLECGYFNATMSRVWCEAFRRNSSRTLPANTNSRSAVRAILEALAAADLSAAKVYLMLVPVAPFMALEHMVRLTRKRLTDGAREEICVSVLDSHVRDAYEAWVKTRVLSYGTSADVSRMLQDIRQASRVNFKRFSGVVDEHAVEKSLNWAKGLVNESSDVRIERVPEFGDDFVANLILLARSGVSIGQDAIAEIALLAQNRSDPGSCSRPSPAVAASAEAAVPRNYVKLLLPDAYYADAREKLLNYGTLGVLVAMDVFDAASPGMGVERTADCLAHYASARLGVTLSEKERLSVLRTSWSLDTAHKAAAIRHPAGVVGPLRTRLFAMRFLRTLCGEPESVARLSRLALMVLPFYSAAFNCTEAPPANC